MDLQVKSSRAVQQMSVNLENILWHEKGPEGQDVSRIAEKQREAQRSIAKLNLAKLLLCKTPRKINQPLVARASETCREDLKFISLL